MAGALAILVPTARAQMPAKPNAVRTQINQSAPAPVSTASAAQPSATVAAQTRPAPAAPSGPRRDPFNPLLGNNPGGGPATPERLPPGKAGLMIGTLRIDGLVRGPNGMIAVVSNPQQRVYFPSGRRPRFRRTSDTHHNGGDFLPADRTRRLRQLPGT